ncbi:hypothetical protein F4678DRAFT_375104 [Xylaria arbuscula]|nr:hypothetical protein F4678DRAFT_375104 [Xylaria arbuscula]
MTEYARARPTLSTSSARLKDQHLDRPSRRAKQTLPDKRGLTLRARVGLQRTIWSSGRYALEHFKAWAGVIGWEAHGIHFSHRLNNTWMVSFWEVWSTRPHHMEKGVGAKKGQGKKRERPDASYARTDGWCPRWRSLRLERGYTQSSHCLSGRGTSWHDTWWCVHVSLQTSRWGSASAWWADWCVGREGKVHTFCKRVPECLDSPCGLPNWWMSRPS